MCRIANFPENQISVKTENWIPGIWPDTKYSRQCRAGAAAFFAQNWLDLGKFVGFGRILGKLRQNLKK